MRSHYITNVFAIQFNSNYIDTQGLPKEEYWHIFMHEYSHLIQGVTTVYGINSFLRFHDKINFLSQKNKQPAQSKTSSIASSHLELIAEVNETTNPSIKWPDGRLLTFSRFITEPSTANSYTAMHDVMVEFLDQVSSEIFQCRIGAREIKEAYSIGVERIASKQEYHNLEEYSIAGTNGFTYYAIERILSNQLGVNDSKSIISICHWSLNSPHPAQELINIINFIKDEISGNDLNCVTINKKLFSRFHEQNTFLLGLIRCEMVKIVKNQGRLNKKDFLYLTYRWYRNFIFRRFLKAIRDKNFPLNTPLCDTKFDLKEFLEDFPIWLYIAKEEDNYTTTDKIQDENINCIYLLLSMNDVINRLNQRVPTWPCCMQNICQHKNDVCSKEPWRRWENTKPNCSYAAACSYLNVSHDNFLLKSDST